MNESYHIKANGEKTTVTPYNKKYFSLEEMQNFVQGYIEVIRIAGGRTLIVNEEGNLNNLPRNEEASKLAGYQIVGDVLVCDNQLLN